jgi:uridine kinase
MFDLTLFCSVIQCSAHRHIFAGIYAVVNERFATLVVIVVFVVIYENRLKIRTASRVGNTVDSANSSKQALEYIANCVRVVILMDGRNVNGSKFVETLLSDEVGVDTVDVISLHFLNWL